MNLLQGETPKAKYEYLKELLSESIAKKTVNEKEIVISEKNGMTINGLNCFESLGLLRYYEKMVWLELTKMQKKSDKQTP